MPVVEDLLRHMKCCLNNDGHIALEPVVLKCGGSACKLCLLDSEDSTTDCYNCNVKHDKKEVQDAPINKYGSYMIHSSLNDLLDYVETKLKHTSSLLSSKFKKNNFYSCFR